MNFDFLVLLPLADDDFTFDGIVAFRFESEGVDTRVDVERTLEASADWLETTDFAESWVERDAEVDEVMRSQGASLSEAAKIQLILDRILDARRANWTERFLWMALLARSQADQGGPWQEFFVLARELDQGRALAEIPIMSAIAEKTLHLVQPF